MAVGRRRAGPRPFGALTSGRVTMHPNVTIAAGTGRTVDVRVASGGDG